MKNCLLLILVFFFSESFAGKAAQCAANYKKYGIPRVPCPKYKTKPLEVSFRVDKAGMTNRKRKNGFRQQKGSLLIKWPNGHFIQHTNFTVSTGKVIDTPSTNYKPQWLSKNHCSSKYNLSPMANAVFIKGGIAIHSGTVTGVPASAGCIRVPFNISLDLYCAIQQIPKSEWAQRVKIAVNPDEKLLPWQMPGTRAYRKNRQPPGLIGQRLSRVRGNNQGRRNDPIGEWLTHNHIQ